EEPLDGTFVDAITALLVRFEEKTGIRGEIEITPGWPQALTPQASLNLYRIIEEALSNIRMHSGARSVRIVLGPHAENELGIVVDDQTLFRTGLASLLGDDERVEVVGQAVDGADGVKQAAKLKPDVVLMDIKMPNVDGIEATRQIMEAVPGIKVLILTTFETDSQVIQALKAGASGYVLKDSSAAAIVSSIVAVMSGEKVMASAVANRVLDMLTGTATPKEFYDGLTNREIEILKLLANGMANK